MYNMYHPFNYCSTIALFYGITEQFLLAESVGTTGIPNQIETLVINRIKNSFIRYFVTNN